MCVKFALFSKSEGERGFKKVHIWLQRALLNYTNDVLLSNVLLLVSIGGLSTPRISIYLCIGSSYWRSAPKQWTLARPPNAGPFAAQLTAHLCLWEGFKSRGSLASTPALGPNRSPS